MKAILGRVKRKRKLHSRCLGIINIPQPRRAIRGKRRRFVLTAIFSLLPGCLGVGCSLPATLSLHGNR